MAPRPIPKRAATPPILNEGLSRELTALDAYTRGNGLLRGSERALGRQLRAQEQEYVDALTKAIRGLGGDTEAEAEELDFTQVKDRAAFLALAYELESAALDFYETAAPRLNTAAPRTLDACACRRSRPAPGGAASGAGCGPCRLGAGGIRRRRSAAGWQRSGRWGMIPA